MRESRLRDANGLAGHQATMDHEEKHHRVKFQGRAFKPHAKRQFPQNPIIVYPVSHNAIKGQRGWNGGAFEEVALARGVLGEDGNSDVESSEAREAAENEECQPNRIGNRSKANGKSDHGGSNTE